MTAARTMPAHAAVRRPLDGRVALVTGGATGIGAAISRTLAAAGAAVAVAHLDQPDQARLVLDAIRNARGLAVDIDTDLTRPNAAAHATDIARDTFGRHVDILINNAGAYPRIPWDQIGDREWAQALETNLTLHFRLCRAATPGMTRHGWGRIVNIGSVNARTGRPGLTAYSTAKAGLIGLTRSLARELGGAGVTVNAVLPGAIAVDAETALPTEHRRSVAEQLARQCIPRRGRPDDVAAAALFLATSAAAFITGQTLHVDGGWILH